ncbi:hypothetical protein [Streptosporangium sp. NPDC000396]|uniref:hypothetical protein n=1 Tax=Streptosporangium sp. NPDC000396 TaxID=3366185 RepID=UPI0036966ECC
MTPPRTPADIARDLEACHPGWVIVWRCWARRFWAFPCWITTDPEAVEAERPQDLLALMHEIELQQPTPGGHPYPPLHPGRRLPAA